MRFSGGKFATNATVNFEPWKQSVSSSSRVCGHTYNVFPPFSSHLRLAERDIDISFLRLCGVKLTEIPGLTLFNVTAGWRSIPSEGRNLFSCKQGCIAHHLSLSPTHCLDMTEILLERIGNHKSAVHPVQL